MTPLQALPELVLVLGIGVIAALVVGALRLPAVAGFMLAGAVMGPAGLSLVKDVHAIELLAEIGVILLLFTIGLEFSLERLRSIARLVAIGGALQVGLTTVATTIVCAAFSIPPARGVFFGFLAALSSTAIVLRGLDERGETEAPHGRFTVGALIFQDLCVIPMMLTVPVLAEAQRGVGDVAPFELFGDLVLALGKAALFVALALGAGRFVVPPMLARVDAARSREVFLIAILVMCAGVAVLSALAGLSLALGAFLAGILLSGSAYGQRAMSNVLPLRDLLTTLFFLSLGMLFDVEVVREQPMLVGALFVALFFAKGLVATLACLAMRFPARVAWLAGIGLAQFGEFGFVLAREGQARGLLTSDDSAPFLAAGLLTMFVTPLAMRLGPHVTAGEKLLRPLERLLGARGIDERDEEGTPLRSHVVIGGYGVGGHMLSKALRALDVPYVVLDLDADAVRAAPAGEPVFLGDVTSEEALLHAHVQDAVAFVLMLNDLDSTRRAVVQARQLAPSIPILVRARRLSQHAELRHLGATDVVTEELEADLELLARVLRVQGTPGNRMSPLIRAAREAHGESARRMGLPRNTKGELGALDALKVESVLVPASSPLLSSTIGALLDDAPGVLVVAMRRDGALLEAPASSTVLQGGDVLYLVGARDAAYRVVAHIDPAVGDPREARASTA